MGLRIKRFRPEVLFILLTVLSATGIVLSFPPAELHILGWFALAPFLFALRQKNFLFATGLSILFGLLYAVGSFMWVITVFETTPSKVLI